MVKEFSSSGFQFWMQRAIQLAALAKGSTSPNPLVGSVVLDKDKNLVGEGFHAKAGQAHAEVGALTQAGLRAQGGTLFVTLEPCCHEGKTPPCTDAILNSGVRRVVVGIEDPDPRVSGKGIEILRAAGLEVIKGVLEDQISYLNRAFIFRIRNGRPWATLKLAMSFDGRTALTNGESKWITGDASRKAVHRLRSQCDAVVVGGGTLRKDDPLLTTRGIACPEPLRVVFSRGQDLPKEAKLWDTSKSQTLVAYGPQFNQSVLDQIPEGPEKVKLPKAEPEHLLKLLASKGCNHILWECGSSLATEAIKQNCVQELVLIMAPKLMGGISARTLLADLGFSSMDQVMELKKVNIEKKGADFLLKMLIE